MGKCSALLTGHDATAVENPLTPPPEEVEADVLELEA